VPLLTPLIDKGIVIPYKSLLCRSLSGRNSAVECQLPKLDVTGSIPVARSKLFSVQIVQAVQFVQTIPERKSTVLLTGISKVSFGLIERLKLFELLQRIAFQW
jgi:hypothetical protein